MTDLGYYANTANSPNSSLTTDFNVTPYYDDFNVNSGYYRLLFKPGYAIQARELTQIQSSLQSQINRFGKWAFKEGSIVLPGAFTIRANLRDTKMNPIDYVKIQTRNSANTAEVNVASFIGQTIHAPSSNISAYILDALDSDGTKANTKTFYVTYLNASPANNALRVFQPGETLVSANAGTAVVLNNDAVANTGYSSWFSISSGVVFAKDHFIAFPSQSVVLDRYNPNPTAKVGFFVYESIVTAAQDALLLDPAQEASNYSAPGADRLKLTPKLAALGFDTAVQLPDFVTLFTIKDGVVQITNEKTQLNILGDTLAGRTNDEAGDYVIKGLNIQIQESQDNGVNKGRYQDANYGNSNQLLVNVDPGHGYCKGYSVTINDKTPIVIDKPQMSKNVSSMGASLTQGQYLIVNEFVGTWEENAGRRFSLYDQPQKRISNYGIPSGQKWSTGSQTGNVIGTASVTNVQYVSGTPGYDAQYNVYLGDYQMVGANSISNVRSLYYNTGVNSKAGADVVGSSLNSTNTKIQGLTSAPLLFYVGSKATKNVRASDLTAATTYNYNRTQGVQVPISLFSNGTYQLVPSFGAGETFPYGTTTLSSTQVLSDLQMAFTQSVNVGPLWGSVSGTGGNNSLTGVGTNFTYLSVGDKIEISGLSGYTFYVAGIANNFSLTLSNNLPSSVVTSSFFKAYKTGDIINLNSLGANTGLQRTVTTTPTSLFFNLQENFTNSACTTPGFTVEYVTRLSNVSEAKKNLNPFYYVVINASTHPNGTSGPYCLGYPDVFQVRKIIQKTGSAPASLTDGTDVTNLFSVFNGQDDAVVNLATITPKSVAIGANDYLLVQLDYFEPTYSTGSYFSIDSYNIVDDYPTAALLGNTSIRTEQVPIYTSVSSGLQFDLRNFIDFRPVASLTATKSNTIGGASVNPTSTVSSYFSSVSGNMKFPVASSPMTYSYNYYLGRVDAVTIDVNSTLAVTEGVPSDNPVAPDIADTQMLLAIVNVPPYPSISPAYGNIIGRKDIACSSKKVSNRVYTMRDIGVLDSRISNLEYYTSLTLLEKSAVSLKIQNSDGLDRFKNGMFVDTFKDTSLTAKGTNPDYRIANDPVELSILPLFSTTSFKYVFLGGSDVTLINNKVLFNYSEVNFFSQQRVTNIRNLERATYLYQGRVTLIPNQDIWIDTSYVADETVSISANGATLAVSTTANPDVAAQVIKNLVNTTWENWKATVTGYNLYRGQGSGKVLVGTYSTEAQARAVAAGWTTAQGGGTATLETVYFNQRIGTNFFSNQSTDTAAGGYKLISSSVIPYIRPQDIKVVVRGMKPYSLLHVFFDSVNVDAYITPLTQSEYNTVIQGNPLPLNRTPISQLVVDVNGNAFFIFKITANGPKFRTGDRLMVITDSQQLSPNDPTSVLDSSTFAKVDFYADGTQQSLQRTVYSTDGFRITTAPNEQHNTSYEDAVLPNTWVPPAPPAYSCFNPEAKVLMADRTWKPIGEVKIGDQVLSANLEINTVVETLKTTVNGRKMVELKENVYATDDHLFLSDKGWKTWNPEHVVGINAVNSVFLEGDNRKNPIDPLDKLKIVELVDDSIETKFVEFGKIGSIVHNNFDPEYEVYDLTLDGDATYIVEGFVVHNCCLAYTVKIRAPNDEEGVFITGYDVFIQNKSPTRGLWFEIRELDSAGQVTNSQVPGTEVWYTSDQVVVSPDGITNPTKVVFRNPVFLFNNKSYAFIVHSVSPTNMTVDPDTTVWISRLGENDLNSGVPITDRQRLGDLFSTTNNIQWDLIPDVDMAINVYRASFDQGVTTFEIGNEPVEKFLLASNTSIDSSRIGDIFVSGDTVSLTGITGGSISVGDILTGNISVGTANGSVLSISTNQYAMSNTRYVTGELVSAYYASNNAPKGVTAVVTAVANSSAKMSFFTSSASNTYTEFTGSSGSFVDGGTIQSSVAGYAYSGQITDILDYKYATVSFEPDVLDFVKTNIGYEMDTYANNATTSSGYQQIHSSETFYFKEEKQVYARTNEVAKVAGDHSNRIRVTFQSTSNYVSPLLDLNSSHTIFIGNLINSNTYGESASSGGYALNKYISQNITLADGQDAEDINVYLTAYKPPGTDVQVYAKLLNANDTDSLNQKPWLQLSYKADGAITYSSLSDRTNFIEFSYQIPSQYMTGPLGEYQYSVNGATYTGYKYFAIKIVMIADNSAVVPRASDLRVIALQV